MKSWVTSGENDHWNVELDVRDLGGHQDTTLRGQPGTIAGSTRKEIVRSAAVGALPLQILRTKSRPSALH